MRTLNPALIQVSRQRMADYWHRRLLRARRERPCDCRADEQRYERAPFHSVASSARASSLSGIVMPSALAVLRLITSNERVVLPALLGRIRDAEHKR